METEQNRNRKARNIFKINMDKVAEVFRNGGNLKKILVKVRH